MGHHGVAVVRQVNTPQLLVQGCSESVQVGYFILHPRSFKPMEETTLVKLWKVLRRVRHASSIEAGAVTELHTVFV